MKTLLVVVASIFLASCSAIPKQATYPLTYQQKMQASSHWNVLANKVALEAPLPPNSVVCISDQDKSPFGKATQLLLTTDLTNLRSGLNIVNGANCAAPSSVEQVGHIMPDAQGSAKGGPYEVFWEVQKVFHRADRKSAGPLWLTAIVEPLQSVFVGGADLQGPGILGWSAGTPAIAGATALGIGLAGPNGPGQSWDWGLLVPFQGIGAYPHSEVIISFGVLDNGIPLPWRHTETFYVNDADRNHYWEVSRNESTTGLSLVKYDTTSR